MASNTGVRTLSEMEIKYVLSRKDSKAQTAFKLNVSKQTIARIRRGQIYKELYQKYTKALPPDYSYAKKEGHTAKRLDPYENNPHFDGWGPNTYKPD